MLPTRPKVVGQSNKVVGQPKKVETIRVRPSKFNNDTGLNWRPTYEQRPYLDWAAKLVGGMSALQQTFCGYFRLNGWEPRPDDFVSGNFIKALTKLPPGFRINKHGHLVIRSTYLAREFLVDHSRVIHACGYWFYVFTKRWGWTVDQALSCVGGYVDSERRVTSELSHFGFVCVIGSLWMFEGLKRDQFCLEKFDFYTAVLSLKEPDIGRFPSPPAYMTVQ